MFVLVIIDPSYPRDRVDTALESCKDLGEPNAKSGTLLSGVWLLDLETDTRFFCTICDRIRAHGIPCKISYFKERPNFIDITKE